MFKNLSLRKKILGICLLLAGIVGLAGAVGTLAMRSIASNYSHIAKVNLPHVNALSDMRAEYRNARLAIRTLGMDGLTPELEEKARASTLQAIAAYEDADRRYNEVLFVSGEQPLYDALNSEWKTYRSEAFRILEISKGHSAENKEAMRTFFYKTAVANTEHFNAAMAALTAFQLKESASWVKKAESVESWGFMVMIATSIVGFLLAVGAGIAFSDALSKSLHRIAANLSSGASEVAAASADISKTSESLSSGATEQAAAIQETASSIEEMSAMVKKSADNANRSNDVARESQTAAGEGKQVVDRMIAAIGEISDSNQQIMEQIKTSNQEISAITKVITEIGSKTKIINDIVFQTKLLSFNASVEAARAGEHGKGFAVVAEEVGNLAQVSGNAAKEISSMLEESIRKVEGIVNGTQMSVEQLVAGARSKVEAGTSVARRCGEVLETLVNNVGQVTQMVGEIATAATEQAQGVQEISKAMGQLDQVTHQNTSASHQAAAASEQLARQAEGLRSSVEELLAAVNGAAGARGPAVETPRRRQTVTAIRPQQSAGTLEIGPVPSGDDVRFREAG